MKKRIFCCAFAFLLCSCSIVGKKEEPRPAVVSPEAAPEYKVEQVRLSDIESTVTVYFSYRQSGTKNYAFDEAGYLGKVYFKDGDQVFAGDLLASLEGYDDAKAEYDSYNEKKEELLKKLDSYTAGLDKEIRVYEIKHKYGFMTDEEYAEKTGSWHDEYDEKIKEIEDEIYILQLRIDRAQELLDKGALYADGTGIVTSAKTVYSNTGKKRNWWDTSESDEEKDRARAYNHISGGEPIITVSDSGSEAFIAETEYASKFELGDSIELNVGSKTVSATVSEVEEGRVVLSPDYANTSVYVGMQVSYQLPLERKEGVNAISKSSIHAADGKYYVYVVGEDGFRQMRWVQTGVSNSMEIEITEGLKLGDIVIKR